MVLATEPIDKKNKDFLRPRLTRVEVEAIKLCLVFFIQRFNGSNLDANAKTLRWIKRLHLRFERLEQGNGFLRPRRGKA